MAPLQDDKMFIPPENETFEQVQRIASNYRPLQKYVLPKGAEKQYQHQFAATYFARLAALKKDVIRIASDAWSDFEIRGEKTSHSPRVLDVRQGQLCWIVGIVFMDMPLKPSVLDDLAKEHWIAAPPPRERFLTTSGEAEIMLEDESGRLRLTGNCLQTELLVTGAIIAAVGTENADGEFEVLDIKLPDLPPQPARWSLADRSETSTKTPRPTGGKVAIVSGLNLSGSTADPLSVSLLLEYLLGESSDPTTQSTARRISRLLIVGNSVSNSAPIPTRAQVATAKEQQRAGNPDPQLYNPAPTEALDTFLSALLPSLPITLLPGAADPTNVAIPQQPLHQALFPLSRSYANAPQEPQQEPSWLDSVTNPWEGDVDGWRFLCTGGQPVDDIMRYSSTSTSDRLDVMEHMLRWRHNAPTAPDTLWSYPYQDADALVMRECPHVYVVGNQPDFQTGVVEGGGGEVVRLVSVPAFEESGVLVLVDCETLEVETVKFEVFEKG